MSIANSKQRRQQRRIQQPSGEIMSTQTQETKTEKIEQTEVRWRKSQIRHFNELQRDVEEADAALKRAQDGVQRANRAVQRFVGYLMDDYELDTTQQWAVGPQGFVLAPERPNEAPGAPVDSVTPTGEEQTPSQE